MARIRWVIVEVSNYPVLLYNQHSQRALQRTSQLLAAQPPHAQSLPDGIAPNHEIASNVQKPPSAADVVFRHHVFCSCFVLFSPKNGCCVLHRASPRTGCIASERHMQAYFAGDLASDCRYPPRPFCGTLLVPQVLVSVVPPLRLLWTQFRQFRQEHSTLCVASTPSLKRE